MVDLNSSREILINEIDMLRMQVAELKEELALYKRDNRIKEKYDIDIIALESILEAIPSALAIISADGKFIYTNKRAKELYGIDYLGSTLDYHLKQVKALRLDGTPYPKEELPVLITLKHGREVRNKEMVVERPDDTKVSVIVSTSPLFDSKGNISSAVAIFEDITNLKRIEKSLNESEEMMETILENSHEIIFMKDIKTNSHLYINSSYLEYMGFTKEELYNLSADKVYSRIHPDDFDETIEQIRILSSGLEATSKFEHRWRVKGGKYRWFSTRCKIVKDENGQALSIIGIARDITERKEREEKLAYQAKVLSNVSDGIIVTDENYVITYVSDGIIVTDENYVITYCNKSFVGLFGGQEEDLIGRAFSDIRKYLIADEESNERIRLAKEEVRNLNKKAKEIKLYEVKYYTKEGTQIIIDINFSVVRNSKGEYKGFIASVRDVSDQYKFQLELKKSEEKYRYLFNSIDEGFAIVEVLFDKENKGQDFRYIEINSAYKKITGISNKNVIGKTARELKFGFEDSLYESYGKVVLTGEPIRFVDEVKSLNIWRNVYVFKIDLEEGSKIGVLFKDITERVLYDNKLLDLIKMQDELYVNVSHELKTPLNVIFSANQLMDMYLGYDSIDDKKDKLIICNKSIKQNCYRLTKLINNIVDLSKNNSGLLKLNLVNVNIVDLVENIVQSITGYVRFRDLKISFDTNVEEKVIASDPDKIERIMLNLISNAIKFSNPDSEIFVNVISKEESVEISVKDSGIGIEKHNLDTIFNRFYQVDKSLNRNAEGIGIGLSLIKSLVELHGGRISVESQVNIGSTFKVELPGTILEEQEVIEQAGNLSNKIDTIEIEFSDIYSINQY